MVYSSRLMLLLVTYLEYVHSQNVQRFDLLKYRAIKGNDQYKVKLTTDVYQDQTKCALECANVCFTFPEKDKSSQPCGILSMMPSKFRVPMVSVNISRC